MSTNEKITTWEDFGIFVWKKRINLPILHNSLFMAVVWDFDWDYGYEHYCQDYKNLTKEEYMQVVDFLKEHTDFKEKIKQRSMYN